ncbi:MAG: hypothetical protein ACKVQQ_23530 [Burkholderiales bacterium]
MHIQRMIEADSGNAWSLLGLGVVAVAILVVWLWLGARRKRRLNERRTGKNSGSAGKQTRIGSRNG